MPNARTKKQPTSQVQVVPNAPIATIPHVPQMQSQIVVPNQHLSNEQTQPQVVQYVVATQPEINSIQENAWKLFQTKAALTFSLCENCRRLLYSGHYSRFVEQVGVNANRISFHMCDECVQGNILMNQTNYFNFSRKNQMINST